MLHSIVPRISALASTLRLYRLPSEGGRIIAMSCNPSTFILSATFSPFRVASQAARGAQYSPDSRAVNALSFLFFDPRFGTEKALHGRPRRRRIRGPGRDSRPRPPGLLFSLETPRAAAVGSADAPPRGAWTWRQNAPGLASLKARLNPSPRISPGQSAASRAGKHGRPRP